MIFTCKVVKRCWNILGGISIGGIAHNETSFTHCTITDQHALDPALRCRPEAALHRGWQISAPESPRGNRRHCRTWSGLVFSTSLGRHRRRHGPFSGFRDSSHSWKRERSTSLRFQRGVHLFDKDKSPLKATFQIKKCLLYLDMKIKYIQSPHVHCRYALTRRAILRPSPKLIWVSTFLPNTVAVPQCTVRRTFDSVWVARSFFFTQGRLLTGIWDRAHDIIYCELHSSVNWSSADLLSLLINSTELARIHASAFLFLISDDFLEIQNG